MAHILIVEDDARLSAILTRLLEDNGNTTMAVFDGEWGLKLALRESFDLVITDLILPGISGLELCKRLKKQKPDLPVLMLTALGTTDDKVEGFDAGADDYLVKPFDNRELLARIKALLKRFGDTQRESVNELSYADLNLNKHTKVACRAGQELKLTPKEFNLLCFFMENPERVLSRNEIGAAVWDTHFDTGTNYIDVYINYLRNKVDKPFDSKLIHTKPGMGFIMKKDAD